MWSKAGHQNGITVNMIAFAISLAKRFPDKNILLLDTNTKFGFLQNYLMTHDNNKSLDALIDKQNTNELNKEIYCSFLNEVKGFKNLFSVNASTNYVFNNIRDMKEDFNSVIDIGKEIFDFVLIDNSAGDSEISRLVNNKSDIIINFMKLNKHLLDYMENTNQLAEVKDKTKYFNVFNMYRDLVGIGPNEITKLWKIENFDMIPYCEELDYQINSNNLIKYISNENNSYISSINSILEKLLIILNIEDSKVIETVDTKKSRFRLFKRR